MEMFRFFRYIILFLLGYKVLKMLFAEATPNEPAARPQERQNVNFNNTPPPPSAPRQPDKFNSAEAIEFEELK